MLLDIETILVDVSEKIYKKNINSFILNSILINNKNLNNKLIKYNYLQLSAKYQIYLFNNKEEARDFEVFKNTYINKKITSIDLHRFKNSFYIYIEGVFYYYNKLEYYLEDSELIDFIKKHLNITIDFTYSYSIDEITNLKSSNKNKANDLQSIVINRKNTFKYYLAYLFFLLCTSSMYYFYLHDKELENKLIIEEKVLKDLNILKLKHTYKAFFLELDNLNSFIKKSKLKIVFIKFNKNKLSLSLDAKHKDSFFKFIKMFKNKVIKSSFVFDENSKYYRCILDVRRN
jgi:hypothetical protein